MFRGMTFLARLTDLGRRLIALAIAAVGQPRLEAVRLPPQPLLSSALAPAHGQTALLASIARRLDLLTRLPLCLGDSRRMAIALREISAARDSLGSEIPADLCLQPARRRRTAPQQT